MTITPIAWRMIYRLMDNVKSVMDDVLKTFLILNEII